MGIDVVGCIHIDPKIFQSSVEGSVLKKGVAAGEIKNIFDYLLSGTENVTKNISGL